MKGKAVFAVGGNALIKDRQHQTVEDQYRTAGEAAEHIADMIQDGWDVVVTHGNAPQVGFILRRSELASDELHEIPLDVCDADAQGAIGYALQQNLLNIFGERKMSKTVVTLITQTEVDPDDLAFTHPTKAIGGVMTRPEAMERSEREGWQIVEEVGRGWRRVVASPEPRRIIELEAIQALLASGIVTIATGGGGIPVVADEHGNRHGVPAVIDKDLTSSLLAIRVEADLLVIGTSVEKVALNWGKPDQRWIDQMTVEEAKRRLAEGTHFAPGSMKPKVEAVVRYLEGGGKRAIISDLEGVRRALDGEAGTQFVP
jgi:carbamate kinase